jgi:hypothetical protein
MKGKTTEIREMLARIDENYEGNPNSAKCVEEYSRKYASLTEKDLNKPFTI